jgi:hypothetical protein
VIDIGLRQDVTVDDGRRLSDRGIAAENRGVVGQIERVACARGGAATCAGAAAANIVADKASTAPPRRNVLMRFVKSFRVLTRVKAEIHDAN